MEKLKIEEGYNGWFCFFEHHGNEYYADLAMTPDCGKECMIFPAKDHKVASWTDLYCNHDMPFSKDGLLSCIKEFVLSL